MCMYPDSRAALTEHEGESKLTAEQPSQEMRCGVALDPWQEVGSDGVAK